MKKDPFGPEEKFKVFIQHDEWKQYIAIYARVYSGGNIYNLVPDKDGIRKELKVEGSFALPLLEMETEAGRDFIQEIVNAAAKINIYPSDYVPPKAEVDAVRYHLEDMRKLVFKN